MTHAVAIRIDVACDCDADAFGAAEVGIGAVSRTHRPHL